MAAVNSSPSGFSYAQAAKGRSPAVTASQASPNKVASGAPAATNGTFSELTPGGNWADDVEESAGEKVAESQKNVHDSGKSVPGKESAVERAKSEDKAQNAASGISSPDLTASASTTTKDDDASSVPTNGSSSETTWETKSQASEPAWIAERKERQSSSQNSDSTVKGEKKPKETSATPAPQKPAVMQPAPPPMVNPWAKRAEEAKAKQAATPPPKPNTGTTSTDVSTFKENQRPRADSRKKASSVSGVSRVGDSAIGTGGEQRTAASFQNKRQNDVRINNLQQPSKPATSGGSPGTPVRAGAQTRSSLPNIPTAPPPVKDQVSWPTPDTAPENPRKEGADKESPEKSSEDVTSTAKPKQKWEKIVVTPNIVWETQGVKGLNAPRGAPSGERGGRGGLRGRGGSRGGPNGLNGGDRFSHRSNPQQGEDGGSTGLTQRGRSSTEDRDAMPPPAKPIRASSATSWRESPAEARPDRSSRGQSLIDAQPFSNDAKQDGRSSEERKAVSSWVEAQSSMPRSKSPNRPENESPSAQDEERIPEPIPRRGSIGTQTEGHDSAEGVPRDGPPIRMVPSESRKEPRTFDSYREPNGNGPTRGAKRGGRGRGGSREFVNGHQPNHAYANGDFPSAPTYGVPPSPSSYHTTRGNHYSYATPSRGGWPRASQRADSVPHAAYGRYGQPYGPSHLQPVPTYVPGMYDYNGYPMTAMSYQPYMEQQYLMGMVSMQLEYYFSIDNLIKDMFLRRNMDSQGFVVLDVVAGFNRMKQLTQDRNILKEVCLQSETIEIKVGDDGQERLRRRDGYEQFILEKDQRNPDAQNDGPQRLHSPEKPQMASFGAMSQARGPASAATPGMQGRYDRRSYDAGHAMTNGVPPQFAGFPAVPEAPYGDVTNGDDMRGRAAKSPIRETMMSPTQQSTLDSEKDAEPDAFADSQMSELTVVVRVKDSAPFHSAATRTFSNGSIDSRSIFGELEKSNDKQASPLTNGELLANGTVAASSASASRHASPHNTTSLDRSGPAPEMQVWWSKNQLEPSPNIPNEGVSEPYTQLRLKALDQRNHAATGTCPYDLDVLYQFWCHFLIRNFNTRMYTEFKYYATDDGKSRHNFTGLQNLVKYYDQALNSHNPIRDRVIKDYVELVNSEPAKLEGTAFKQLRSAWRNGALNLKNRKKLADIVDDALKARLDES